MSKNLGRRAPTDFKHVEKYGISVEPVAVVNRELKLPAWHKTHDQGMEGSCVGHGAAMERAITNTRQNVTSLSPWPQVRRYNPLHIWNEAKKIDEWDDTNPGDDNGTSVRAAYDILRTQGAQRVKGMKVNADGRPYPVWPSTGEYPVEVSEGIAANRWTTKVDEMRACIGGGIPVVIGVNWYSAFDYPVERRISAFRTEYWFSENTGSIRGGHCVCVYAASDKKQAFKIKNSWGNVYPEAWMSYTLMQRLLNEYGEAAIVTDR